jgi:dihydrodipicolinate synthase/N-acetylneuraminate lyase
VQLVVPALTFHRPDGALDADGIRRYIRPAAGTWAQLFLLNGTTAGGHEATVAERAAVLDVWAGAVDSARLAACCWTPDDAAEAAQRGIIPMVVLRDLAADRNALALFAGLPRPACLFSHP